MTDWKWKSRLLALALIAQCGGAIAQEGVQPFRAYIVNNEYSVYLRINLYDNDVEVPGQSLYGPLPGYLGKKNNSFCWVIVNSQLRSDREAKLQLINDFGSEDLTATLTQENDTVYTLRQESGSPIKVPNKGKWLKLPKVLKFVRR